MEDKCKEIRSLGCEVRAVTKEGEDSRAVEGYALVFGARSVDLGGFVETIDAHALDGVLEESDVLALLDHRSSRGVLARSRKGKGSLSLEVDSEGLVYRFNAPKTALGDELLEGLIRGDINQSSFAFSVADEKWEKLPDGSYLRTILRFEKIYDVSPVYHPAYPDTTVARRSLEEKRKGDQPAEATKIEDTTTEKGERSITFNEITL